MPQGTNFTTDASTWPQAPVILITGGNGGVGFGIAQRLLEQLSQPHPPDTQCPENPTAASSFCTPNGCRLVIASRNEVKGRAALSDLLFAVRLACRGRTKGRGKSDYLHEQQQGQEQQRARSGQHRILESAEYTACWLSNLQLDFVKLDLSSVDQTLEAADLVRSQCGYLTHLVFNAAAAPNVGLNLFGVFKGLLTCPVDTLTSSANCIEEPGRMTDDGLGWTWQCNVFGHYLLARQLLPLLYASKHKESRIIWTSSLEASEHYFDPKDPMALSTSNSYASTKYQALLLSLDFNRYIRDYERSRALGQKHQQVKSFTVEPGIVFSDMMAEFLGSILMFFQKLTFFVARLLGLSKVTYTAYAAGMAFAFVALTPLAALSQIIDQTRRQEKEGGEGVGVVEKVRFGSRATRLGAGYCEPELVGTSQDDEMAALRHDKNAKELTERCESLYQGFLTVRTGGQA